MAIWHAPEAWLRTGRDAYTPQQLPITSTLKNHSKYGRNITDTAVKIKAHRYLQLASYCCWYKGTTTPRGTSSPHCYCWHKHKQPELHLTALLQLGTMRWKWEMHLQQPRYISARYTRCERADVYRALSNFSSTRGAKLERLREHHYTAPQTHFIIILTLQIDRKYTATPPQTKNYPTPRRESPRN
jgi:hypothetical protein